TRKMDLDLHVVAITGEPLRITGTTGAGATATVQSTEPLEPADSLAADSPLIQAQLGRLGGTHYRLRALDSAIAGSPMVPMSLLTSLRRDLVALLDQAAAAPPPRSIAAGPALPALLEPLAHERRREQSAARSRPDLSGLSVLCRRIDQIEAALKLGVGVIY